MMEMMRGNELSVWAVEAAVATGLPVWNGISTLRDDQGNVVSFHDKQTPWADWGPRLLAAGGEVAGIMHTIMNDMDPSLDELPPRRLLIKKNPLEWSNESPIKICPTKPQPEPF